MKPEEVKYGLLFSTIGTGDTYTVMNDVGVKHTLAVDTIYRWDFTVFVKRGLNIILWEYIGRDVYVTK